MSKLLELAERCEKATGPDVGLAKDIFCAVFPERVPRVVPMGQYGWRDDTAGWWLATGEDTRVPPRTIYPPNWLGSLDAAMTLVPEGWAWMLGCAPGEAFFASLAVMDDGLQAPEVGVNAATPALALCAAALRALAAQEDQSQAVGS
jgi:hypothetical protein